MDKILISNSFKNLLQSLGAKTSNSNYAVPVVTAGSGTTAGTPQGYMDMASLASVLGGMKQIELAPSTDMNTIFKTGLYCSTSGTIINGGITMGIWIVFSALVTGDVYCTLQIGVDGRGKDGNLPKWRKCWNNASNGWSSWHNFPL